MLTNSNFLWPSSFSCTLVNENIILPNSYSIGISIEPHTNSPENISIGFKKIRYFIENYLDNSIFINRNNPLTPALEHVSVNKVFFPTEPYDYFVGSILFNKFIVISQKYFDITYITIDSIIGDLVQYTIYDPEESGVNLIEENWCNLDNVDTGSNDTTSWNDLNIQDIPKFEPTIIRGGLNGNRSIRPS
jgi:hypothetical protein